MALYLLSRPRGAEQLRNPGGLHGALVDAADANAAVAAANALAAPFGLPTAFNGFTATLVAATAQGGFVPALIEGEVTGPAYGVRRGT